MVYILRDVCTKLPYCIHMHSYIRISLSMWFTLVVVGGITCFAYQKADLHNLSVCVCVGGGGGGGGGVESLLL